MSKRKKKVQVKPAGSATRSARPASAPRERLLDNLLLGLCGFGILLTAYLSYGALFGAQPLYCGAGSTCDVVQSSRWSTLLGLPMATWGLATYALLARLVWRRRTRATAWRMAFFVALCAFAISLYLTTTSLVVIRATCGYCLTSFATISAILLLLALRKPPDALQFPWSSALTTSAAAALLVVAGLHFHYSGLFDPAAGPEKPVIRALAEHLAGSGAKFYGAYWCPSCNEQKAFFEASAERLPYVECAPNGPKGGLTATCATLGIQNYPTWIIDGRRYTGRLSLRELARYSGFAVPEGGFDGAG
jgi:uncharacterized membrane protein